MLDRLALPLYDRWLKSLTDQELLTFQKHILEECIQDKIIPDTPLEELSAVEIRKIYTDLRDRLQEDISREIDLLAWWPATRGVRQDDSEG